VGMAWWDAGCGWTLARRSAASAAVGVAGGEAAGLSGDGPGPVGAGEAEGQQPAQVERCDAVLQPEIERVALLAGHARGIMRNRQRHRAAGRHRAELAREAGYSRVDVLPIANDFWRFYRLDR
jgi:hypothetical protein